MKSRENGEMSTESSSLGTTGRAEESSVRIFLQGGDAASMTGAGRL